MNELLRRLHSETYVLDVRDEIDSLDAIEGFAIRLLDSTTLEACITRDVGVARLLAALTERGIEVLSLRNKQNRLEQLFIDMVRNGAVAREDVS